MFITLATDLLAWARTVVVRRRRPDKRGSVLDFFNGARGSGTAPPPATGMGTRHNSTEINSANVMICAVMRDEEVYVDEWIQYHQLLGFDFVHLFDNSVNGSAKMGYLPQKYNNFVRVTHAPGDDIKTKAFSHCAKKYSSSATWAVLLDADEFIVLRKHDSIRNFIRDTATYGGTIALNRYAFGSSGELNYKDAPVLTRFTMRSATPDKVTKSIVFLPDVVRVDPLIVHMKAGVPTVDSQGQRITADTASKNSRSSVKIEEVAVVNHYYTKSLEEFRRKHSRDTSSSGSLGTSDSGTSKSSDKSRTAAPDKDSKSVDLMEFITSESRANAIQDTFARDFYISKAQKTTA